MKLVGQNILKFLRQLEQLRPFTKTEAWTLFRWAALSEAFGWTILLLGIMINHFKLPGYHYAVPIAGQIHGTIFLIYFGVLLAVASSLRWSRWKFLVSILAGIPPYGTLAFELWAAHSYKTIGRTGSLPTVRAIIRHGQTIMAVQPSKGIGWQLPGGPIGPDETAEAALQRHIQGLTGTGVTTQQLLPDKSSRELYFDTTIANLETIDFKKIIKSNPSIDDIRFIEPYKIPFLDSQAL